MAPSHKPSAAMARKIRAFRPGDAPALLLPPPDQLRRSAISRVFLELRESNLPARALYERHGFVPSGRRKAYYHGPVEDALCMMRKLIGIPDAKLPDLPS